MAAQSIPVMDSSVQFIFDDDSNTAKRMKKEPGAVTGKSIVVLKESDVITRNEMVFMPNTIEMAQLKKPDKGQFKTNVLISSKMTEMDIKRVLVETFPFLAYRRFCCAAAVDNRTRLDFHGERRIWDGQFIKRKIKGNSALYIFTNEESVNHKDSKASEQSTPKYPYNQITVIENNESEQLMKTETKPEDVTTLPLSHTAHPAAHQTIHPKESGDYSDSKMAEQSTLKRSHDQITTRKNVNPEQLKETSSEDITKPSLTHTAYLSSEKQAKLFVETSFSPKSIANQPSVVPETSMTAAASGVILEKREHLHPTKVQLLQQKPLNQITPEKEYVFVPVTAQQGIMTPVCHPSISAHHDARSAKDVVVVAAPAISQAVPVGTIVVPGGIVTPGAIPRAIITTPSDQQFLGKAVFHIADGRTTARHAGLPLVAQSVPRVMVSSTLTPQMNNLNISNAASAHSQKPGYLEKSTEKRDQSAQTEENRDLSERVHLVTAVSQCDRDRVYAADSSKKAATGQQHVSSRFPDQSKQSPDEEKCSSSSQAVEGSGCVDNAKDKHHNEPAGTSVSDHESQPSGPHDSGIETSDNPGEDNIQAEQIYLHVAMAAQKHEKKVDKVVGAEWTESEIEGEGGLDLLSDVALHSYKIRSAVTETTSIVEEICPKRSSTEGGSPFFIISNVPLPYNVEFGQAFFGSIAPVTLTRVNEFNMTGCIPASPTTGPVTVKVYTSRGIYLGETSFEYYDECELALQRVIRDKTLLATFFRLFAEDLENKPSETPKAQTSESIGFKSTDTKRHGRTKNVFQQTAQQGLKKKESGGEIYKTGEHTENPETECDYDADDEASSTGSSEEADVYCNTSCHPNFEIVSFNADIVDPEEKKAEETESPGLQWELDGTNDLRPCHSCQPLTTLTQNMTKQVTSLDLKSETFCQTGDRCDEEEYLTQMMLSLALEPENVPINDNLENLPSNFHGQERVGGIGPLDSPALPLSRREITGAGIDSCNTAQDNKEAPERSNIPENTETENMDRQLNLIDFDENSESDKARRSHARRSNEMNNSPAADL